MRVLNCFVVVETGFKLAAQMISEPEWSERGRSSGCDTAGEGSDDGGLVRVEEEWAREAGSI
jgi:hypothetical protein